MPEKHFAITIAYNGAPFSGFARQPGQFTVQGNIEDALELLFRMPVETVCAGRTDAGVHARGQVVSFSVPEEAMDGRELSQLRYSLNALTDEAISIRAWDEVSEDFSARFSAKEREYRYFIYQEEAPAIFLRDFSWHMREPLDVVAMEEASRCLIGEHDFKSFCVTASAIGKPTSRNITEISFAEKRIMGEQVLVITVKGNAFLHSMVRTMVGTLVAVGRGKREPGWVREVLEACDRNAAGETAPAQGLILWKVTY